MGMLSRAQSRKPQKVTVEIDEGIYESLKSIGVMRDIHPDTIIEMKLLAYIRAYERGQVFGPTDIMPYGQYKGYVIEEVIKVDPRYVCWLLTESAIFQLNEDAIDLLNSLKGDDEEPFGFSYDEKKPKDINDV